MSTSSVPGPRRSGFFRKFLVVMLIFVGCVTILAVTVGLLVGLASQLGKGRIADKTVLELDLNREVVEFAPDDPFAVLMQAKVLTVLDIVEALAKASDDDRIVGLVARVGDAGAGLGRYQEIRDAILAFRQSGKRTIAYAESFGEFSSGNGSYYLASAFDKIYLQPSGDIGLTGLMYESMFLRGALDKLDVVPKMDHRYEYKNAMNMYTEKKYTKAHREAMQVLMDSQFAQVLRGIAQARGLSVDQVKALIDKGPYLGKEAVDAGLVDALAYRDEVREHVWSEFGKDAKMLFLSKYLERAGRLHTKGDTIALVYGLGAVTRGKNSFDPLFGTTMGSDSVAAAFRAAIDDEDVKAIVFRVDSPGGSYVASDTIWRETLRAKTAGKPVIVTMGDVAGSGGYFVAMSADKIVAQPGTITGSIGVLGGKLITTGLYSKLGLSFDEVHTSGNSVFWSAVHDYTPAGWSRLQDWLDRVYDDFTTKVAEGRALPMEKVLEIAKGRIWTGEDAKDLGLVDELGGYTVALRLAREAAGLAPDAPIRLKTFPKKKSPLQVFLKMEEEHSAHAAGADALLRVIEMARPLVPLAKALGMGPQAGVLSMPPVEPVR